MKTTSDDIWDRLHKQIEQLNAAQSGRPDPEALATKLADRGKALRQRMSAESPVGARMSFLGFRKGPQRYGIPIEDVIEVQALEHFSPVPNAPAFVSGVIHCRGAILSLFDLGMLFGISGSGHRRPAYLRHRGGRRTSCCGCHRRDRRPVQRSGKSSETRARTSRRHPGGMGSGCS